jgi:HK97 family phage portal protein
LGLAKTVFQKLFKIDPNESASQGTGAKFLNGDSSEYSRYTGDVYANQLVRGIVHKIANYCSLISLEHVRGYGNSFQKMNDHISRLLTVKPNEFMTPSELVYKFFTDLFVTNNAYLWVQRDKSTGDAIALLPVVCDHVKMVEYNGFLFYKFYFEKGDVLTVYSGDVVHRRRFYYKNDWFGDDNEPLRDSIGLNDTMNVSIDASLKNGAQIKGILQHQNTIDPNDLEKHERLFRESYLKASNNGGVGMIDAKFNFIPIPYSGKIIDAEQMKEIRDYIYRYFNMNDEIMMSKYNSEQWLSFHQGTIAPELNGLEQSLRIKLFSDKQIGFGHRIVSSVNAITFMSPQQRIQMVKLALDGALYNRNEMRGWFGDAPIPGGDTYQYSKNFTEDVSNNPNKENMEGNNEEQTSETDSATGVPNKSEDT